LHLIKEDGRMLNQGEKVAFLKALANFYKGLRGGLECSIGIEGGSKLYASRNVSDMAEPSSLSFDSKLRTVTFFCSHDPS